SLPMSPGRIGEGASTRVNFRQVHEYLQDVQIFPIPMPKLRLARAGLRREIVPNVVVPHPRQHAEIGVRNLQDARLQREACVDGQWIESRSDTQVLELECLLPYLPRVRSVQTCL